MVLNKVDRLLDEDRVAILAKLRERLAGIVPAEDVVSVAAAPRPTPIRITRPDGSVQTAHEPEPPDLGALEDRIAAVLRREGDALRAGNLLLRAHLLSKKAQEQVGQEREERRRQSSTSSSGSPPPPSSPTRFPRSTCWPTARSSFR